MMERGVSAHGANEVRPPERFTATATRRQAWKSCATADGPVPYPRGGGAAARCARRRPRLPLCAEGVVPRWRPGSRVKVVRKYAQKAGHELSVHTHTHTHARGTLVATKGEEKTSSRDTIERRNSANLKQATLPGGSVAGNQLRLSRLRPRTNRERVLTGVLAASYLILSRNAKAQAVRDVQVLLRRAGEAAASAY